LSHPQQQTTIARRLFALAAPIIGLNTLTVLTLAVDMAMCGRLPDSETVLTGLGYATQLVFLLLIAMMGLSVGTVALIARAHGAGETDRVNHLLVQSTQLTLGVSIAVAIVGNILAAPLLQLLNASPAEVAVGVEYLRPMLSLTIFYYLSILYASALRGVGNTRLPFLVSLVTNAINLLLDYGLILGNLGMPALGVQGAALATVLSHGVGVTILIILLHRGAVDNVRMSLRPRRIDLGLAAQLFRIGAPAALDMLIINVAFLSIIGMLGRIDPITVAAHGVGLRIQALAFVPGLSVAQATGAMVGQALGAGRVDEARQVLRASLVLCTAIMTVLAGLIVAAAYPIVGIFDVAAGSELESYAVTWMRLLGYGMPLAALHISFVGLLQGAGSTRTSLWINFIGTLLIQIPLSALLGFPLGLGAVGVWLAFPLSFLAKVFLAWGAYQRGNWAKTGLTI
jgi:multidrug resistance protein, MATE family